MKSTVIISCCFVVACLGIIYYFEYDRYYFVATEDSTLYVFDKKNQELSRCNSDGCSAVELKFSKDARDSSDSRIERGGKMFIDDSMVSSVSSGGIKPKMQKPNSETVVAERVAPAASGSVSVTKKTVDKVKHQ
jgi:hypothetical protein